MKTNISYIIVFTLSLLFSNSFSNDKPADFKKFVVVIDAGHGGKDPGKPSKTGVREKDVALKIALLIGEELGRNKEIEVLYTRKTDVFVELDRRGEIANKAKADLFISIHCNAHTSQASGAETYVLGLHRNNTNFEVAKAENEVIFLEDNYEEKYAQYNLNSPESLIGLTLMQEEFLDQSIQLASLVQDNFREKLNRKDRSVKQAGFVVLHQTVMPSILIETGFITNNEEGKYLNSSTGQKEIAHAIATAIEEYKGNVSANDFLGITKVVPAVEVKDIVSDSEVYMVQIAASSKSVEPKSYNFKGLAEITRAKEGKLYKYYYGDTSNYSDIQRKLSEAKSKGYKSAYIVSFKNGVKRKVN
ncbi:N-acetylmuramoyl-L-alanine amidase [Leeuwenhoekiella sp. NPDC079379]|uniref:N-acetylmuramoyl-L-alanine amidase n=1 Tax=Leeuwenhoekiella sp. NPDC079379 TaxID=3364122 RepID=UPI0037C9F1F7